jgi:glycine hydroxymethyltransferase
MTSSPLHSYLSATPVDQVNPGTVQFLASLELVKTEAPEIVEAIIAELNGQRSSLKLIASENYSSLAVQAAASNLLTDKYAEGFPFHRFYAGCDNVDTIEASACSLACSLFGAEHAYVQPHSGADANMVAFTAILAARVQDKFLAERENANPDDLDTQTWNTLRTEMMSQRIMAFDLRSGGHLTHGYRRNFSSIMFEVHPYQVDRDTHLLNLDTLRKQAHEVKPLILLAGYSAYPRRINFAKMREIADEVGAVFMVDMAHFAGLVAGKVFTGDYDPVAHAHIVTSTTHKTLRGPRGGIVLCKKEFADYVNKGCPAVLGGPLAHIMAAKAVAFHEALRPSFRDYAQAVVKNAQALGEAFASRGVPVISGGTDNHLILLNVAERFGLTGRQAETALRECSVTLNRNTIPFDPQGAWFTSGLRLGTPALTTRGLGTVEMNEVASIIFDALSEATPAQIESGKNAGQISKGKADVPDAIKLSSRERVSKLLMNFPLYPEIPEL